LPAAAEPVRVSAAKREVLVRVIDTTEHDVDAQRGQEVFQDMRRGPSRSLVAALLSVISLAAGCGHAQPATGPNRDPSVPVDPNYPEQNCQVNPTIDCRPAPGIGLRRAHSVRPRDLANVSRRTGQEQRCPPTT
jgi:hypothetical protein